MMGETRDKLLQVLKRFFPRQQYRTAPHCTVPSEPSGQREARRSSGGTGGWASICGPVRFSFLFFSSLNFITFFFHRHSCNV